MLLLSTVAGLAGALTLAAGVPTAAAVPPVNVISCDYSSLHGSGSMLIPETAPFQTSNVRITFENRAPLVATDVRFAVDYGSRTQIVDYAGTFSSGTPITEDFTPSAIPGYDGSAACSVQSVTFSDGSTWQPA